MCNTVNDPVALKFIATGVGDVRFEGERILGCAASKRIVHSEIHPIGSHDVNKDKAIRGIANLTSCVVAEGIELLAFVGLVVPAKQ